MCSVTGVNLQRGMNFRLRDVQSTILMSLRPGAPYGDHVEDEGRVLIYEGHDVARTVSGPHPKQVDQSERNPRGSLTQNGLFAEAARKYKDAIAPPETVRVYEKIRSGIWVYNGLFELIDCWTEQSGERRVGFQVQAQCCCHRRSGSSKNRPSCAGRRSADTKLGKARSMEARSRARPRDPRNRVLSNIPGQHPSTRILRRKKSPGSRVACYKVVSR